MTRLASSLLLIAALAAMPRAAQASPSTVATIASLPTIAVATEPGVAEAVTAPTTTTTTQVSVTVSTDAAAPSPGTAVAPEATPEATVAPEPAAAPPVVDHPPPPDDRYRYADQIHDDRKSGRGLLAGGLTLAGSAYLFTSLAGALAIDRSRDLTDDPLTEIDEGRRGDRRRAYGQALMVPGVGPALAIARADTAVRAWAAGFAGLTQAVGVGLALVGVHRLARARRLERLSLSAMGSSGQAHVALHVRF